jgi:hypothetical protein
MPDRNPTAIIHIFFEVYAIENTCFLINGQAFFSLLSGKDMLFLNFSLANFLGVTF